MAKNKTTENNLSVNDYVSKITDTTKQSDFQKVIDLMQKVSGFEPKMWGTAIVGFGSYHYVYESGREGDAPILGCSARVNAITLYLGTNFENREELLNQLGKHKTGKGCLYIKNLEDIKVDVLETMVHNSMKHRINNNNEK
jgi:hypothetical protein